MLQNTHEILHRRDSTKDKFLCAGISNIIKYKNRTHYHFFIEIDNVRDIRTFKQFLQYKFSALYNCDLLVLNSSVNKSDIPYKHNLHILSPNLITANKCRAMQSQFVDKFKPFGDTNYLSIAVFKNAHISSLSGGKIKLGNTLRISDKKNKPVMYEDYIIYNHNNKLLNISLIDIYKKVLPDAIYLAFCQKHKIIRCPVTKLIYVTTKS